MSHDLDQDLALARQSLDQATQLRNGRKIDTRRREEEETAYLRAVAFALVYLAESFRPGHDPAP